MVPLIYATPHIVLAWLRLLYLYLENAYRNAAGNTNKYAWPESRAMASELPFPAEGTIPISPRAIPASPSATSWPQVRPKEFYSKSLRFLLRSYWRGVLLGSTTGLFRSTEYRSRTLTTPLRSKSWGTRGTRSRWSSRGGPYNTSTVTVWVRHTLGPR